MKGGGHTEKSTATVIGAVTVALIVAAASFYAGTQYQSRKQPTMMGLRGGFQNSGRGLNGGGNRTGFRPVAGEITKVDDSSITVKLQDGSSKIVVVSDSTDINKADKVTRAELKEGNKVAVFGETNADGTVTAQSIQLNPVFRSATPPPGN